MAALSFEIITAGVFDSQVKYGSDPVSPHRFVYDYEIEYYEKGKGVLYLSGTEYQLKRGSLIIAKPGDIRSSSLPVLSYFVHLRVEDGPLRSFLDALPSYIESAGDTDYPYLFQNIARLFVSGRIEQEILALSEAARLIYSLYESEISYNKSRLSDSTGNIISKAQQYIEDNYAHEIPIEDLAAFCEVSPSYLHKLFMRTLNESPHQVILKRRIAKAKMLLVNGNLTMSEIAAATGFHSQAYFSDCFRRVIGVSPGDYRRSSTHQV